MEKKLFEPPKIFTYGNDVSKHWYVQYKYYCPDTDKLKVYKTQGREFIGQGINSILPADKRFKAILQLQDAVNERLCSGWAPINLPENIKNRLAKPFVLLYAVYDTLRYKKAYLKPRSYETIVIHTKIFVEWLKINQLCNIKPSDFSIKLALDFLTWLNNERQVKNRTRNNYQSSLRAIFNFFPKCGYFVAKNPFEDIKKVPNKSEMHLLYNQTEYKRVSHYLKQNDPYLRIFIIFICCGMRPSEIVQLQLCDIDDIEGIIRVWASVEKSGTPKFKRIHKIYLNEIQAMELYQYPAHYYLFSISEKPGAKPTTRDYFTRRFNKVKKALGLNKYHTQYSFRHTTAVDLAKNGATLQEIRSVTGHESLGALQMYLEKYLATTPSDFSDKLTNKL